MIYLTEHKCAPKDNYELRKTIDLVLKEKLRLEEIDVSYVQNFSNVFEGFIFDKDNFGTIENWDVSQGKNFREMFKNTKNCLFDLSNWNVSSAQNIEGMFESSDFKGTGLNKWYLHAHFCKSTLVLNPDKDAVEDLIRIDYSYDGLADFANNSNLEIAPNLICHKYNKVGYLIIDYPFLRKEINLIIGDKVKKIKSNKKVIKI